MNKRLALLLCLFLTPAALYARIGSDKAMYVGGTVPGLKERTEGTISAGDEKELVFEYKEGKLSIPYDRINNIEYGQKAGRRVGLAVAISPAVLFSKKKHHYITVYYLNANEKEQAAVFELGKDIVRVTLSILEARTGHKVEYQDEESRNDVK